DPTKPKEFVQKFPKFFELVRDKYRVDELYDKIILNPVVRMSEMLWLHADVKVIDRATYKLSEFILNSGEGARYLQNGNMQRYALYIVVGFFVLISVVVF